MVQPPEPALDQIRVGAIRAAVASLNRGDIDGYLSCFDSDALRWIDGYSTPLTFADVENNLRQLQSAFAGLRLDELLIMGDSRHVCARWRLQGVHVDEFLGYEATQQPISLETCEIYEFGDRSVITSWVYGDPLRVLEQITPTKALRSH
jgi:predicted ester cyclase